MENKHRFNFTFSLVNILALFISSAFAENTPAQAALPDANKNALDPQFLFLFVLGIFIVVLLVVLYMLYALNIFLKNAKKSGAIKDVPAFLKFTDPVPIEREHEILLDHHYD